MGFSRLHQHLPWASRKGQKKLAQPTETFPDEAPERPDHALADARGNDFAAVQALDAVQTQTNTVSMQLGPRKLQRPAPRQYAQPHPDFLPNDARMHPYHQHGPSLPNNWTQPYPGHATPQHQPVVAPFPPNPGYMIPGPQYYTPPYVRPEPPTPVLEELTNWPSAPMPVPPYPSAFQSPQHQAMSPWTPNRPPLEYWNSRAVPLYEMPPPDLMDYDMSWMIGVRMLPEWNKGKEDRHWDEVRRARSAALRWESGEDRDACTIL